MRLLIRGRLAAAWLLAALGGPAFAIQTQKVELGYGGAYDGAAGIERDALGRLIFKDAELPDGAALSQLRGPDLPANTVTVAPSGARFTDVTEAYAAAPEGGVVLVFPGDYVLTQPLVLTAKNCSFLALDAGATTLTLTAHDICAGIDGVFTGGEDWSDPASYQPVGRVLFDGFSLNAETGTAVRIQGADMSGGGLAFRRCRFKANRAILADCGSGCGHSTAARLTVEDCDFQPDGSLYSTAIWMKNDSRSGAGPAFYDIRGNRFNTGAFAPRAPGRVPPEAAVLLGGTDETTEIEDNAFQDYSFTVIATGPGSRLHLQENLIRFDSDSSLGLFYALGLAVSDGFSGEAVVEDNQIDIRDAAPSGAVCAGMAFHLSSPGSVIRSRRNAIEAAGDGARGAYCDLPGSDAFELRISGDCWDGSDISAGTMIIEPTGDRRIGAARVDGALDARGGAIFNADQADVDLAVKGVGADPLLFADASTDRVGVRTGAPTEALTVAGNMAVAGSGSAVSAGAGGDGVLAFGPGSTPAAATNAAQLYSRDSFGSAELFVKDEAGNETLLSSHAEPPGGFRDDDPMPHTLSSRNEFLGKEVVVYVTAAIRRLERLTGEQFIWVRDLPEAREWTRKDEPPPAWVAKRARAAREGKPGTSSGGERGKNEPAAPTPASTATSDAPSGPARTPTPAPPPWPFGAGSSASAPRAGTKGAKP